MARRTRRQGARSGSALVTLGLFATLAVQPSGSAAIGAVPGALDPGRIEAAGSFEYSGSPGSGVSLSTTGAASWDPRSVEVTLRPVAGTAGSAGLVLDYQDSGNHYLFLFSTNSAALMIYRAQGGAYTLLAQAPVSAALGAEHVLRAEADTAGNLRLFWDGTLRVSAVDGTYTSGGIGLRVWNMVARFDDVVAREASGAVIFTDDFEDGNDDGWTAGAGWSVVPTITNPMPAPVADTNFEGGNGIVSHDPGTWTVYVQPELKGSSPYRAWFYAKLSNLSTEQPVTLSFPSASFFTRAYYSYDDETWSVLPPGNTLTFEHETVWVAHSIPYLTSHVDRLVSDLAGPA